MSPFDIGKRIRGLRDSKGWTITELAERAKVRRATVSRLEHARIHAIDLDVLERLADALGVSPSYFLEREPAAKRTTRST